MLLQAGFLSTGKKQSMFAVPDSTEAKVCPALAFTHCVSSHVMYRPSLYSLTLRVDAAQKVSCLLSNAVKECLMYATIAIVMKGVVGSVSCK